MGKMGSFSTYLEVNLAPMPKMPLDKSENTAHINLTANHKELGLRYLTMTNDDELLIGKTLGKSKAEYCIPLSKYKFERNDYDFSKKIINIHGDDLYLQMEFIQKEVFSLWEDKIELALQTRPIHANERHENIYESITKYYSAVKRDDTYEDIDAVDKSPKRKILGNNNMSI